MNKTRRVIAISPVPEQVVLAAECRSDWDELMVAGAWRLNTVIRQLRTDKDCSHLIILVPKVRDSGAIQRELQALAKAGTGVTWQHRKDSRKVADARRGNLWDWLQYKCSICKMMNLDPAPLVEAADYLATSGSNQPPTDDAASVKRILEADFPYLEGWSGKVRALRERVAQVGPVEIRALIVGETGTGKESVALYLHEFSARRQKHFVALNCAGLDENLLRSELFGHEKGAFTGAVSKTDGLVKQADGGTLFLDELGDMPLAVQADLLRFIQTGRFRRVGGKTEESVNIRIVAAAQPDIHERIKDGRFRPDLYYRIAEVELRTPALREIPGDIQAVIMNLVFRFAGRTEIGGAAIKKHLDYFQGGHDLLLSQTWPGNVRELAAMVKRRVLLNDDVLADLKKTNAAPTVTVPGKLAEIRPIDDVIREYVKGVMDNRSPLTQQEVAERLGRSVNTLKKLLAE